MSAQRANPIAARIVGITCVFTHEWPNLVRLIDAIKAATPKPDEPKAPEHPCPCCGGRMIIIETFERGSAPRIRG